MFSGAELLNNTSKLHNDTEPEASWEALWNFLQEWISRPKVLRGLPGGAVLVAGPKMCCVIPGHAAQSILSLSPGCPFGFLGEEGGAWTGLVWLGKQSEILIASGDETEGPYRVFVIDRKELRKVIRRARRRTKSSPDAEKLKREALNAGAECRKVTPEGYTRLPDIMMTDLGLWEGGYLWFLKGKTMWEAWIEDELNKMFGGDDE